MGICSTTYGDLVCRGCKRFAHEITAWNGYDDEQRRQIWQRLNDLRDEVTAQFLEVNGHVDFVAVSVHAAVDECAELEQRYRVLAYLVHQEWPLHKAGLAVSAEVEASLETPLAVMQAIDAEIYQRAKAHYERNFKTPA